MPNKNKNKNKSNNSKATKAPRKRNRNRQNNVLAPLVRMVQDPCKAPLVPGLYGETEGYLTKFHKSSNATLGACGYIVWFPDMLGTTGDDPAPNLSVFIPTAGDPDLAPTNTIANPYGSAVVFTEAATASEIPEPAYPFVAATTDGFRTLNACMSLNYTGRMDATQGEIAVLTGVPISAMFSGPSHVPPTVNRLFTYAEGTQRLSLDGHEVKWRPTDTSHNFKPVGELQNHSAIRYEAGLFETQATDLGRAYQPEAIVIAWRSCAADFRATMNFIRGLEWIPATDEGMVNPSPLSTGSPSVYSTVTRILDQAQRGWDRLPAAARDGVRNMVIQTAQAGFSLYKSNPRQLRIL